MKLFHALSIAAQQGSSRFIFFGFGVFAIYWSIENEVYVQGALSLAVTLICLAWISSDVRRALAELPK